MTHQLRNVPICCVLIDVVVAGVGVIRDSSSGGVGRTQVAAAEQLRLRNVYMDYVIVYVVVAGVAPSSETAAVEVLASDSPPIT